MSQPTPYRFFAAPLSLYSGKIRSYLRKKGVDFIELFPTHPEHLSKVLPAVGRMVLPTMLTADDTVLQDTTEIIDAIEALEADNLMLPEDPVALFVARLLECFGDEGLLRPAMHYRWSFPDHNEPFISYEFARAAHHKADLATARAMAGPTMEKMQSYLPILGISEATIPAIEAEYLAFLKLLNAHLMDYPYLLGDKPSIADFGFMGPLYAHLGRDPYPAALMKREASHVFRWVERMNAPGLDVPELAGAEPKMLDARALPDSLLAVLETLKPSFLPEMVALFGFLNDYIENHADEIEEGSDVTGSSVKRGLGTMPVNLWGKPVTLAARHFSAWKLQRVLDVYEHADEDAQQAIKTILEKTGLTALLDLKLTRRIERSNFKEVWGEAAAS